MDEHLGHSSPLPDVWTANMTILAHPVIALKTLKHTCTSTATESILFRKDLG